MKPSVLTIMFFLCRFSLICLYAPWMFSTWTEHSLHIYWKFGYSGDCCGNTQWHGNPSKRKEEIRNAHVQQTCKWESVNGPLMGFCVFQKSDRPIHSKTNHPVSVDRYLLVIWFTFLMKLHKLCVQTASDKARPCHSFQQRDGDYRRQWPLAAESGLV